MACRDTFRECQSWAQSGECYKNPEAMKAQLRQEAEEQRRVEMRHIEQKQSEIARHQTALEKEQERMQKEADQTGGRMSGS